MHTFGRIAELREASIALNSASAYFRADDDKFTDPRKVAFFAEIDGNLAMLPEDAWKQIKVDLLGRIAKRDSKRNWQPLFDTFNEVRVYNFLQGMGCEDIRFIPRAKNLRTPDLGAAHNGASILCEVKTINTSDEELQRRASHGVGASSNVVDKELLTKLSSDIAKATNQMAAFNPDALHMVYVVINFDDWVGDYAEHHLAQIIHFLRHTLRPPIELVTDVRTAFLTKVESYYVPGP